MKKVWCLVIVLVLALSMACSVFAADGSENDDEFTSSVAVDSGWVQYKDDSGKNIWGEIVTEDDLGGCISIIGEECILDVSVFEAMHNEGVPAAIKDKLIDIYHAILGNDIEFPYDQIDSRLKPEYMVIRDLIDLSWLCDEHKEWDEKDGHYVKLTFNVGVKENLPVYAMVYNGEEWVPAIDVVNNDDGTVTVIMEDIGMVAFSVIDEAHMPLWMSRMYEYIVKVAAYLI